MFLDHTDSETRSADFGLSSFLPAKSERNSMKRTSTLRDFKLWEGTKLFAFKEDNVRGFSVYLIVILEMADNYTTLSIT